MGPIFSVSELWLIGVVGILSAGICDVEWHCKSGPRVELISVHLAGRQRGEFHKDKDKDKETGWERDREQGDREKASCV